MTVELDIRFMGLDALRHAYADGTLTPVQVAETLLAAADALNPRLNCFTAVTREIALSQARASTDRWQDKAPLGPLDGIPISIKDTLMVRGIPFRRGSRATPDTPATQNAPVVDRVLEQGAVVIGITTTPEFGVGPITISPLTGITRNPWDLSKNSGGSSGGAAASVAAGLACVALATDAGGSTRIPAGFCGVVGLKPTGGRLPTYPPNVAGALSCPGVIARSVGDAAAVMDVLAQADSRDAEMADPPAAGWPDIGKIQLRALRVALTTDLGYAPRVSEEVIGRVEHAAAQLRDTGLNVERRHPEIDNPIDTFNTLFRAGFGYALRNFTDDQFAVIGDTLRAAVTKGRGISLHDYLEAQDARRALAATFARFFEEFDILLTPMTSVPAFEADRWVPESFEDMDDPRAWTPFGYPVNLIQCPAVTVPGGLSKDGLPIGLQVIGPRFGEEKVLAVAALLEFRLQGLPKIPTALETVA